MKRVVVTGIGIVSCLGNDKESVLDSLKAGRSGIQHNPTYEEIGMRSHVSGSVQIDTAELIDRKILRFMGDASAYAYLAMEQAISDANLTQDEVSSFRSGLVVGSGGGSSEEQLESTDIMRKPFSRMISVDSSCSSEEPPPDPTTNPERKLDTSSCVRLASDIAFSMARYA